MTLFFYFLAGSVFLGGFFYLLLTPGNRTKIYNMFESHIKPNIKENRFYEWEFMTSFNIWCDEFERRGIHHSDRVKIIEEISRTLSKVKISMDNMNIIISYMPGLRVDIIDCYKLEWFVICDMIARHSFWADNFFITMAQVFHSKANEATIK